MRVLLGLTALIMSLGAAAAAELDCAPLRIVVPYSAGGATDVAARLVAERFERQLKKSVVVENRPGATGNIGTVAVTQARPDGCTLLVNAAVIATFPASFARLAYDPLKDLIPIGGIGETPTLVVTAAANPAKDVKGLVDAGKAGNLNFSTAGYGLLQHLAIEEIAQRTGAKFTHVAYKGGAQAVTDLVAGRVEFGSFAAGSVLPLVRDGKLKALGVIQEKRTSLAPEVRTLAEQGLPNLPAGVHFMLYAPAGTPGDVVATLSGELRKITGDPGLKERFQKIAFDPTPTTSEDMTAVMRRTGEVWIPVIKRLGIRLD
jgi:tripartite-type tricarboxylate transporter receptor subunit TctC